MVDLGLDRLSQKWIAERTIILGPSGSYAYGTFNENSDHDYKGVVIPPKEYYFGLESFNEYNNTGGKNYKNTKDDVDVTIKHINKFVHEAVEGAPQALELLFLRPEDFMKLTRLGKMLVDNRHLFLARENVKRKYGGFARNTINILKNKGYDPKVFAQGVRLLITAIEIFEEGDFCTYSYMRDFIKECRSGKYSPEESMLLLEH